MKKRARLMSENECAAIEDASEEVAVLTTQGYSPTEAIAKVASAYQFPIHKTELLTYAYTNGVAAEKRASAGGPFERLSSFPMPDPVKIRELVYGKSSADTDADASDTKTASMSEVMPLGMRMFDIDLTNVSPEHIRDTLGFSRQKTASSDNDASNDPNNTSGSDSKSGKSGHGMSITQTTVRVSLYNPSSKKAQDDRFIHKIPETIQERLDAGLKMMSPELSNEIDSVLSRFINDKKAEIYRVRGEADEAYQEVFGLLSGMDRLIKSRSVTPSYKAAGLASINAYYPDVARIIAPRVGEVDAYLIKTATYSPLDISSQHSWVECAKLIYDALDKTAELNLAVQKCEEEYIAATDLFNNRPRYKAADWATFTKDAGIPGVGKALSLANPKGLADLDAVMSKVKGLSGSVLGAGGKDDKAAKRKHEIFRDVADDMNDPLHELDLKDIEIKNMLNDFAVNDEILSAFSVSDILKGYNDLLHTAPSTMRNKAQARALLQQHMTQGRMAPTELMPALQMNKLTGHDASDNSSNV
jgi:hypothetical protein